MGIWETVKGFFENIFGGFNNFLQNSLDIDGKLLSLYNQFIVPLPEIVKILGAVFVGILLILGVISFVKKLLKLFIVIAVIFVIIFVVTQLR
ncbi:MAG: hypothetical protein IH571_01055 [Acholeplasmataceae bacterium]|nr:hypothetical protein [Acholeplasmataceae bacterium]